MNVLGEIRSGDSILVRVAPSGNGSDVEINGKSIGGMISRVALECDANAATRLIMTVVFPNGQVSGRLVLDADWEQFLAWRKQQV